MSATAGSADLTPSAVGGDIRRLVHLTWLLAVTDFKLRFFGSVLGYLWSLARPLLLFGVYYVVFTQVFQLGKGVKYYPLYMLTGLMLWSFFTETTSICVTSLVARENLLRKVHFPRMAIPLSVSLTAMFNLGLNLVAVVVFALAAGVPVRATWLLAPLLLGMLVPFTVGIGALLSALYVRFRDVAPIWEVVAQALFYGTPVLYVITLVPSDFQPWLMLNPIADVMTQMRHWVLDPSAPTASEVIGGTVYLLAPVAITIGALALGLRVFAREAPRIAELL